MRFFISSTYEDLVEYRNFTINYLTNLTDNKTGNIAAMEFFAASQNTCKEECLKELEKSDVVIGIYGNVYGSIDKETGKSMTEVEFDYAIEHNKPVLGFVIRGDWEEHQKCFIENKVFFQKKSCARFKSLKEYADRLDDSLKIYFNKFEGFSFSSIWGEVKEIKKDADKEIAEAIPRMEVYEDGNETQAIYDMMNSLNSVSNFVLEVQKLYNYIYEPSEYIKAEDVPLIGWEETFLGIPSCIKKLKVSILYMALCQAQHRLLLEPWTNELRLDILKAKENYVQVAGKMYYND